MDMMARCMVTGGSGLGFLCALSVFLALSCKATIPDRKRVIIGCPGNTVKARNYKSKVQCANGKILLPEQNLSIAKYDSYFTHNGRKVEVKFDTINASHVYSAELYDERLLILGEASSNEGYLYFLPQRKLLIYDLEDSNMYEVVFHSPLFIVAQPEYDANEGKLTRPKIKSTFIGYDPRLLKDVLGFFAIDQISISDRNITLTEMWGERVLYLKLSKQQTY